MQANLWLDAVTKNGNELIAVPPDIPEYHKICLAAVNQNGLSLRYAKERTSHQLCLSAVHQNGMALKYVPSKTFELCLAAVQQTPKALEFVPLQPNYSDLCLEAVRQDGMVVEFVKETPEYANICLEAVRQNGMAIDFVKETPEFEKICIEAVQQNPLAIKHVPEPIKTIIHAMSTPLYGKLGDTFTHVKSYLGGRKNNKSIKHGRFKRRSRKRTYGRSL
jgi:hypothetical protein